MYSRRELALLKPLLLLSADEDAVEVVDSGRLSDAVAVGFLSGETALRAALALNLSSREMRRFDSPSSSLDDDVDVSPLLQVLLRLDVDEKLLEREELGLIVLNSRSVDER